MVFEPIQGLDALELGVYWNSRREAFPKKDLQPALMDGPSFAIGALPMRAILVSPDDSLLLQLQFDRFYLNWRATGTSYPSFSGRDGKPGLLKKAMEEFAQFKAFCLARFGLEPKPVQVELAKIDHLVMGRDWKDIADLARILPITDTFHRIQRIESRELNLRFVERTEKGTLLVFIGANATPDGNAPVRIESRMVVPLTSTIEEALAGANKDLNEVFFNLIEKNELARFEPKRAE